MIELRQYQKEAVEATVSALANNESNPCIVAPTGSGKSIIIAFLVKRLLEIKPKATFLVLAHVKELIQQNYRKILTVLPEVNVGIFCSGLGKKEALKQITFGSLMSCVRSLGLFQDIDYIIIDEVHRLNPEAESSYQKIISYFGCQIIGLTATPFRTTEGSIVGGNNVLGKICYNISIQSLIKDGYISKPITKDALSRINTDGMHLKQGDFDLNEMADKMECLVNKSIQEIADKAALRKHFICFCCTIEHAILVCDKLNEAGITAQVLHSKVSRENRNKIVEDFQNQKYKCLVNVSILTEGFDAPFVDCIILMRATVSPGLYYQMVGRGFRTAPGKDNFLILDFGENARRHGCIDDIKNNPLEGFSNKKKSAPIKICPMCQTVLAIKEKFCKECQYEFISAAKLISDNVNSWVDERDILSNGQYKNKSVIKEYQVASVKYNAHHKENKPPSMVVTYSTKGTIFSNEFNDYICFLHEGYAHTRAVKWWFANIEGFRPMPASKNIDDYVNDARKYAKKPLTIKVKQNGKFWNVVD